MLGPSDLTTGKETRGREIFQIFMVSDHINGVRGSFEVMSPNLKSRVDGQEFFVMSVVVQFGWGKGTGVKRDRVDVHVRSLCGEDCGNSVVGGISLNDDRSIRNPVRKDRSGNERFLEGLERIPAFVRKQPRSSFPGKARKRNNDTGVIMYEATVEIGEPKERLHVFDFPRFGPILNDADFSRVHSKTFRR